MKPHPFDYFKPDTLQEALAILDQADGDARPLAGGQSLLSAMNMRFAAPGRLVDLGAIDGLQGIAIQDGFLRIGALTRQSVLATSPEIARNAPLIAAAMPHVAHAAIRNRGTFGGSLCNADPASELPACVLALNGRFNIEGSGGARQVGADDFFLGTYTTCLEPNELLISVDLPLVAEGHLFFFDELVRRHGDFAMAGLAATASQRSGALADVRLAFFGVAETPVQAPAAAALIEGRAPAAIDLDGVAQALARDITPFDDLTTSAATKRHYMNVLCRRALTQWQEQGDVP